MGNCFSQVGYFLFVDDVYLDRFAALYNRHISLHLCIMKRSYHQQIYFFVPFMRKLISCLFPDVHIDP